MCVYDVALLDRYTVTGGEMRKNIETCIANVSGDFRQEDIMDRWGAVLADVDKKAFRAVRVSVHCASGTYIRSLAHELGKRLGTDAVLTRLVRTRVGMFGENDSISLDGSETQIARCRS
jgi:tRNA U55 pseudouridine synthase TruB